MTTPLYPVAIIGAGPYGLAAAAHLQAAGVETRVFGKPMEFWQRQMPRGMFLRSSWKASHISDPHHALTLNAYQTKQSIQLSTPVPLAGFITYGQWFQRQVAPDLDPRRVTRIAPILGGFQLWVEDGELFQAQRVVIATGIAPFAYRPAQFDGLPPSFVSHSSDHCDLRPFAGKQVVVVGGGQSAIESAVLLDEGGAKVEVIVREPQVRWLRTRGWLRNQPRLIRELLYPPTDVGPPGLNQIVARPDLFRLLPQGLQQRIAYRSIRPAAAGWLLPRAAEVQITTKRNIVSAAPCGDQLCLTLNDGTRRHADHLLLATGYRVDVSRYAFLGSELVQSLQLVEGYPPLSAGFESTVPGMHFLGAPAAWSFGPLMRFVSGTSYTARALTRCVLDGAVGKGGRSWI